MTFWGFWLHFGRPLGAQISIKRLSEIRQKMRCPKRVTTGEYRGGPADQKKKKTDFEAPLSHFLRIQNEKRHPAPWLWAPFLETKIHQNHDFLISFFRRFSGWHFLCIREAFGPHFGWFWEAKWSINRKRRKYEKPHFYLSQKHVFEVSDHQNRH